jgi:hypothetical protein
MDAASFRNRKHPKSWPQRFGTAALRRNSNRNQQIEKQTLQSRPMQ